MEQAHEDVNQEKAIAVCDKEKLRTFTKSKVVASPI
jgi:hypothetical protein